MKTDDQGFDSALRDALTREEAELLDRLGRPTSIDLVTDLFRGSLRWVNLYGLVLSLVFFGLTVYFLVGFLNASEPASLIRWGVGFGSSLLMLMAIKIWFWLDMQRHAQLRELKRLELQVAHLASQLRESTGGGPGIER